jgi:hypothetical protein
MSTVGFWLVVRRLSDSELRAQEASRQVFELMSSAEAAPALSPQLCFVSAPNTNISSPSFSLRTRNNRFFDPHA